MKNLNIKNYSTTIPAFKTISEIEELLTVFGVRRTMKDIDNNQIAGLIFTVIVNDKEVAIKFPVKADKLQEYLYREYIRKTARPRKDKEDFREQAINSAWRMAKEWIHIQLSYIQAEQAEILEVFLPYAVTNLQTQSTLFEDFKNNNLKLLPEFNG